MLGYRKTSTLQTEIVDKSQEPMAKILTTKMWNFIINNFIEKNDSLDVINDLEEYFEYILYIWISGFSLFKSLGQQPKYKFN